MTAEVSTFKPFHILPTPQDLAQRRLAIGFMNWAHALDHFVILIYPTVVIAAGGDLRPHLCFADCARDRFHSSPSGCLAAGGLACRPLGAGAT